MGRPKRQRQRSIRRETKAGGSLSWHKQAGNQLWEQERHWNTDFKGEPAFFGRKNKVSASLGCPTQDIHDSALEVYSLLHKNMQKQLGGFSSSVKLKLDLKSGTQNLRNIVLINNKRTIFKDLPCTTQELWGVVGLHPRPLEGYSSQLENNLGFLFLQSLALTAIQLPISATNKAITLTNVLY